MQYAIVFLEGIITFVSPCLLPMLPLYISYFAGGKDASRAKTMKNAAGFILGFTVVFLLLGAFAGSVGRLLQQYQTAVNLVTGAVVVVFGLHFLGVLRIGFLNRTRETGANVQELGFVSSLLFGIAFSISWTPCVGAFLGSALMLASQQGSVQQGIWMLLCYSLGLGIPFFVSALLIDQLKSTFDFIKRHYTVINRISGLLLVAVGILMMSGMMGRFLSLLTF